MSASCRACGAPIEWVFTESGRRMPLDIHSDPKANIIVDPTGTARVVKPGEGVRISHYATCPDAAKFRKPKGRALP